MKQNRIVYTTLLLGALLLGMSLASCRQDPAVCTTHTDANTDMVCDVCGQAMPTDDTGASDTAEVTETDTEAAVEVSVTLTVKDQEGTAMAGAVLDLLREGESSAAATVTADENGTATVTLTEGTYTVRYQSLPQYVLGYSATVVVESGMEAVLLEVTNNTPNGSTERPFVISDESITVNVPAGEAYCFTLFGGTGRTLIVENAHAEVTYNGTVYPPDENGRIEVRMATASASEHIIFTLKNTADAAEDMTASLYSDPGTMENPFVAKAGEDIVCEVPKDASVYYTFTATFTGTLQLHTEDVINNISMTNLNTSKTTNFSNGSTEPQVIGVNEGDVVSIIVSTVGGDTTLATQTVTFTIVQEIQ